MAKMKFDAGKFATRLLGNINLEETAIQLAPKLLPGIIAGIPQLAQLGITGEMVHAAFAPNPNAPQGQQEQTGYDLPDDGAFRLARDWGAMTKDEIHDGIARILSDDNFGDAQSIVCNALYYAIGLNAAEKQARVANGRANAITVS